MPDRLTRRLVADVGGSNVRFALADRDGGLAQVASYPVKDFRSFAAALDAYAAAAGGRLETDGCAIAAAGPVDGDRVTLTNLAWTVDRNAVSVALGGVPVALLNDLEAVAAALPHLTSGELTAIGDPTPRRPEHRTMLALNVGTGFGAAAAIERGGRWWTVPSEAGHMALAAGSDGGCVEDVLSGHGIAALYGRLAAAAGPAVEPLHDAGQVFARIPGDAIAAATVAAMTDLMGRIAGGLALASAAWGGVYFCGSVATAWAGLADAGRFRAEFARNGRMQQRLRQVPTAVIRRDNVALYGLAMLPLPG